jgi:hypothetical protein
VTARDLVERCILVASPPVLSEADYAEASAELEEVLAALPEVISVYATGGVSAPGISDLDRIAVAEAPVTSDPWERLSRPTRQVAMHGPFLVDRATFERHRWFAYLEPLRLVLGETIDVDEPDETNLLGQLLAVEGLVLAFLKLHKQLGTGRIKMRSTLCLLHALRHSLELGGIPQDAAPGAWRLVGEVADLRASWFSLETGERDERMRETVARAVVALPHAISHLSLPKVASQAAPASFIRLSPPWKAFSLIRTDDPQRTAGSLPRPTPKPLVRLRRLTEAHWRMRRFAVDLVAPAFDLLALERRPDGSRPLAKRRAIVRAYGAYLGASTGQWSAIGFADSFTVE